MKTTIDGIQLDPENLEFNQAADFVSSTDRIVFLTGKAGTGKTTFLKYIKSLTNKNTVVVAPTGVAAINAGGVTISSFFQVPFGPFVPNDKRLRTRKDPDDTDETSIYSTFRYRQEKRIIIENLELLIIDEISMVRADTLDVIDTILRVFRRNKNVPFGGVQVFLIGDVFQLPPIANENNNEWQILSQFYDSRYFFSSHVMKELIEQKNYLHFELKKIYRQKNQKFIDLLNNIREGQVSEFDLSLLNANLNPAFTPDESDNYIILSTHNYKVNQINQTKLDALPSELQIFTGTLTGEFPKDSKGEYILPTDMDLHLKEGVQVMFLKNDSGDQKRYYNGKIGKMKFLSSEKITVEIFNEVRQEQEEVIVEKAVWNHIEYIWNKEKKKVEEKIKGTFTQYPLRLAWAITVHKSQGLTFTQVIADVNAAFEVGQVYVALSRCTSLEGLSLRSRIPRQAIKTSQEAVDFSLNETPSPIIETHLNNGKADFLYRKAREAIKSRNFPATIDALSKALSIRNELESEIFKRYFKVYSKWLTRSSERAKSLSEELEAVKEDYEDVNERNRTLQNELLASRTKIEEFNKATKLLLDKVATLEKDLNEQREELSANNDEVLTLSTSLDTASKLIETQEQQIQQLLKKFNASSEELNRIKSLPWYKKPWS